MRGFVVLLVGVVLSGLASPGGLRAQPQEIRFDHLTVEDGLSSNNVTAILQDHAGYVWIGTQKGLNRYDGYRFEVYLSDPEDTTSLSADWVNTLYEDHEGHLWVGTDGGLDRFDRETETFEHHRPGPPGSRQNMVRALAQDADGSFWAGTAEGLTRFDPATGTFTRRYRHAPDDPSSLSASWIDNVLLSSDGSLWIGTAVGLDQLDRQTGTVRRHRINPRGSQPSGVRPIVEDGQGLFWIGTAAGLARFDPRTGTVVRRYRHDPNDPNSLLRNESAALHLDRQGILWIGTYGGLNHFDPRTETFTPYANDPGRAQSLGSNTIVQLYEDRSGILWIGTSFGGIDRFDPQAGYFTHYQHQAGQPNSLNNNAVLALYQDRTDPRVLWIGTGGGGLNRFDRATNRFSSYRQRPGDPASLLHDHVEAVYRDRAGRLWVGTRRGLSRLNPDGRTFTQAFHQHREPLYNWIRFIYEAPSEPGVLWLASGEGGLVRFDPGAGTVDRYQHDATDATTLGSNWVSCILEDHAGVLWVSTEGGGLHRFDRERGRFRRYQHASGVSTSLPSNDVFALFEDAQGVLWLGTGRGLVRFDAAREHFRRFDREASSLAHQVVYGVLGDGAGNLWLSTLSGLARFDPRQEAFQTYDTDRGVQARAFNPFAYHRTAGGELLFGGVNGFNAFYPERIGINPRPPEVVITRLSVLNQPAGAQRAHVVSAGAPAPLALHHDENDLLFEYVALHFSNPSRNQYAYRLEPYEKAWRNVGTQRSATYTNLDPGTYTFRVKAANADLVWNDAGASIRVVIHPPWWRTAWAYAAYALLFAGTLVALYRFQRRRLLVQERERAHRVLEQAYTALDDSHRHLAYAHQTLQATQAQLVHQEKLASLGALTAGIAHEIQNPLNFVNNFAELSTELTDEIRQALEGWRGRPADDAIEAVSDLLTDLKTSAQKIAEHGWRAESIVRSMLDLSRGEAGEPEEVHLNPFVEEYVSLAYHGMRAQQPGFTCALEQAYDPAAGVVRLVPQQIGRVLLNLLDNAFDALQDKAAHADGPFTPCVNVQTQAANGHVTIRVRDNGPGIPKALQQKIFEPFFTTKPPGSGTGLGLSLAAEIVVQGHRGTFTVESEEGVFTAFVITLPRSQAAS